MDLGIKGRRAIVTGGSSGIGFETARLFLDEGVRVLITGREMAKVNQARDALAKESGGEVHAIVADMTKQADITRMVEFAKEKFGGVDLVVRVRRVECNSYGHVSSNLRSRRRISTGV